MSVLQFDLQAGPYNPPTCLRKPEDGVPGPTRKGTVTSSWANGMALCDRRDLSQECSFQVEKSMDDVRVRGIEDEEMKDEDRERWLDAAVEY